jgi:hypothetical protein
MRKILTTDCDAHSACHRIEEILINDFGASARQANATFCSNAECYFETTVIFDGDNHSIKISSMGLRRIWIEIEAGEEISEKILNEIIKTYISKPSASGYFHDLNIEP